MATMRIGIISGIVGIVVGGLIVAWAYGLDWSQGMGVVAILLGGFVLALYASVLLPIGNVMVKVIALVVVFALIVLFGLQWLGVF